MVLHRFLHKKDQIKALNLKKNKSSHKRESIGKQCQINITL